MQYELVIDKELESLCPKLTPDELSGLEASIESDGCRDDIIIWANHDKTIIDGHNRYRICKKLSKAYKTRSLSFATKDEVKLWMLRNQMSRRNLSDSQRAMMAARLANLGHGGDRRSEQAATLPVETQASAAEKFGVSERTVRSAKAVEKNGSEALKAAVTNGDIAVSAAEVLAKKPKAEQNKIVAKGPEAVKAEAKKAKKPKPEKPAEPVAEESPVNEFLAMELAPAKDGFGDDVTGELRHVFQVCAEFKEKRQQLTNLKTWITQRMNHPGCAVLASGESRIKTDIDNLDSELKFATPYCVCVYCKNKMPKLANCNACKGRGWITQEIYKQAPKELKRA